MKMMLLVLMAIAGGILWERFDWSAIKFHDAGKVEHSVTEK